MTTVDGDENARTLERRMRFGFAASIVVRVLESIGVGWFACALTLAAARYESSTSTSLAWGPAAIAGMCASLSWWLEAAPNFERFVRRVDRRNAFGGALATACDATTRDSRGRARPSALVALLVARLERTLTTRACLTAALPKTPAVLAAPLLGIALFLADVDARTLASTVTLVDASVALSDAARDLRSVSSVSAVAAAPNSTASNSVASNPADPSPTSSSSVAKVTDLARAVERSARALSERVGSARTRAELDRLQQDLSALRADLIRAWTEHASDALAAAELRSLAAVDVARAAVRVEISAAEARANADRSLAGAADAASAPSRASPSPMGASRDPASASSSASSMPAGSSSPISGFESRSSSSSAAAGSDNAVAPSAADGRMSAPNAGTSPVDGASATANSPAIEHGTTSLRWWAPTYDAVVERWFEARRSTRDP